LGREEFINRCATELGLIVTLTSREHHQGVGRCERNHDTLTHCAEAMLQRAGLKTCWLLPARAYAQYLLNRQTSSAAAGAESRYQKYFRKVPDFGKLTPYLFWTLVSMVGDVRGPKGSLDHPCGSLGHFVGIEGASYVVWRPGRGTVHQHHVRPLNEQALARSGLPPAVALHDASSQTLFDASPSPACVAAPPRAASPPPPVVDLPLGTRLDVAWQSRGSSPDTAWYSGEIVDSTTMSTGRRRHYIAYDGWPHEDWFWHDLASGDFEWRFSRQPTSRAPPPIERATTRARAELDAGPQALYARRLVAASALGDLALESCSEQDHLPRFNAALFQVLGDDSAPYACASVSGLDEARVALLVAARGLPSPLLSARHDLQCNKASQNVIDVQTPTGIFQWTIPATHREVSAQRDEWLAACRVTLDAILAWPGNHLVNISVPRALGISPARCVTQYRLKLNAATGQLEDRNGVKVRHCLDGGHQLVLLARDGFTGHVQTSSSVVDDLVIKMLVADAAGHNRCLV